MFTVGLLFNKLTRKLVASLFECQTISLNKFVSRLDNIVINPVRPITYVTGGHLYLYIICKAYTNI